MSNSYLNAVWPLRLSPMRKLLLVALADQATHDGVTRISHGKLARMTNQSRATVKRELKALVTGGLLEVRQTATARSVQQYGLTVNPGITLSPAITVSPGLSDVGGVGSHRDASDPLTDPYVQASRGREISTGPRQEMPTNAQLLKLTYVILDDPQTQLTDDVGDLIEMLKRACAQADFVYDSGTVQAVVNQALASRGLKPWLPLKGQRR